MSTIDVSAVRLLVDAIGELESAAWSRDWTRLKNARDEFESLTGIALKGKLRSELQRERFKAEALRESHQAVDARILKGEGSPATGSATQDRSSSLSSSREGAR